MKSFLRWWCDASNEPKLSGVETFWKPEAETAKMWPTPETSCATSQPTSQTTAASPSRPSELMHQTQKRSQEKNFFFFFVLFKHKLYRKNCRLQWDSNSDRRNKRRARWPLDHHHHQKRRNLSQNLISSVCTSSTFTYEALWFSDANGQPQWIDNSNASRYYSIPIWKLLK